MINQLPYDIQLIVYKHLHKSTLTDTLRDMMNQLKSKPPYLRAMGYRSECFDKKLECRISSMHLKGGFGLYYDEYFLRVWETPGSSGKWLYPYWYYWSSDIFENTRARHNLINLKLY